MVVLERELKKSRGHVMRWIRANPERAREVLVSCFYEGADGQARLNSKVMVDAFLKASGWQEPN